MTRSSKTGDVSQGLPAGSTPFNIDDTVGAWVPHGKFILSPTTQGSLSGLRFAVKDIFDVAGYPTGAGNPTWLATHPVPTVSSPLVEQLRAAGAEVVGKVITDELAYSLNGDNVHYGTPINVNAPGRVPGGSSSGSVAAVAARLCDFALGSDTGGSTRVPASYCGVWGLRTTHDLLTRENVVPLHPSFDTMTWFAHDADTFARVAQVLLPSTATTFRRVFKPMELWELAHSDFEAHLNRVLATAEKLLAAPSQDISFTQPGETLEDWRRAYATAGAHEAWSLHGDWINAQHPTFSAPITSRWELASTISDDAACRAREKVGAIRQQVRDLLGTDGIAIVPSAAGVAPARDASGEAVDALRMRNMQITCVAGISGVCQVSIPFRNAEGLPVGISLIGPAGSDLALIRLAIAIAGAS